MLKEQEKPKEPEANMEDSLQWLPRVFLLPEMCCSMFRQWGTTGMRCDRGCLLSSVLNVLMLSWTAYLYAYL